MLKERAAEVGFDMAMTDESRAWNTFDAHRLLTWAAIEGKQVALKKALFEAYFSKGKNPSDPDTLVAVAEQAGLDAATARDILASQSFAEDVRQEETLWRARGINAVPAMIFDGKYLVSGAQPAGTFEAVVRKIAEQTQAA